MKPFKKLINLKISQGYECECVNFRTSKHAMQNLVLLGLSLKGPSKPWVPPAYWRIQNEDQS